MLPEMPAVVPGVQEPIRVEEYTDWDADDLLRILTDCDVM
jgi:hypothetical protein